MGLVLPTTEQAKQFALMLATGVPATDALRYFLPEDVHEDVVKELAPRWLRCAAVRDAQVVLNGAEWSVLSPQARIEKALEKHYSEMAYFLFTTNYGDLDGAKKSKADSCRNALEAKLAGMQGQMNELARFYMDQLEKANATAAGHKPLSH